MDKITAIQAFRDNYIWMLCNSQKQSGVIIDPGIAEPVVDTLKNLSVQLSAILITHHHADHCGGVTELLRHPELLRHFDVPVYGPPNVAGVTHPLDQPQQINLTSLNLSFDVLCIPGHTLDHIAFYGNGMLFCGDTLFCGGCGRLFEGTAAQMLNSLNKLASLPEDTLVYCGHEYTEANLLFASIVEPNNPELKNRLLEVQTMRSQGKPSVPSTIKLEKLTNPFLRCEIASVKDAVQTFAGKTLTNTVDVFANLRRWKDGWTI